MRTRWLSLLCLSVAALSWAALAAPAEGKKYALVVGVSDYESRHFPKLRYTGNDADKLATLLEAQAYTVRLLTNARGEKDAADRPTASNIRKALLAITQGKTRKDLVLLALSGHGIQLQVSDPEEKEKSRNYSYFCPMDASLAAPVSFSTGTCDKLVSLNDAMDALGKCDAGSKFVLLDACRNEMKATATSRSADPAGVKVPPGVGVLFSCKSGEKSFEVEKLRHGLFFHHVLEGLRGEAKNKRGEVSWNRLVAHVAEEVKANAGEAVGGGADQVPFSSGVEVADAVLLREQVGKTPIVTEWPKEFTNSIGMKLVRIPKGKFSMGSPESDREAVLKVLNVKEMPPWLQAEGPEHEVEITKAFHLGVYEVTQKEFKAVMGYNPSYFSRDGTKSEGRYSSDPAGGKDKLGTDDPESFPVENVSWEEAKAFCERLSAHAKEKAEKRLYRLPSEAEWEYACRGGAGSKTLFHFGKTLSSDQANFNGNFPYGGTAKSTYLERTCKVGSYKPNGYGLYDMHGNVDEWCRDWYGEKYYADGPKADPVGPSEGSYRAFRGGSWNSGGRGCRSAYRFGNAPSSRGNTFGFRVALVPIK